MKNVLLFIAVILAAGSSTAQELQIDDLSQLATEIEHITGDLYKISYDYDSRVLMLTSYGKINGTDYSGGGQSKMEEYPLRIALKITEEPTEQRKEQFESASKKQSEYRHHMSKNAKILAGLSRENPESLSREDWAEFFRYCELAREFDSLLLATHSYKSLYFIHASKWDIDLSKRQNADGKQLIDDQNKILTLLTDLTLQP